MPTVDPTRNSTPASVPQHHAGALPPPGPLVTPETSGGTPLDVLSEMLMAIERQNQSSLKVSLAEIEAAHAHMVELQRELAEELKRALDAARQAQHKKKGGWFSRTFGGAIDAVAKVVGKYAEITKDLAMVQVDVAVSVVKNFRNGEALLHSLKHDLLELSESSETERAVAGFTSGTLKFVGDLTAFQLVLVAALAENGAEGDALHHALRDQSQKLWHSLETNILENPDFWTVTGKLAEAVAVTSALASGGTLAPVAVVILLALEADNRYGYIDDLAGKKAAPWVRVGLHAAAAAAAGFGGNASEVLTWIQATVSVIQGVGAVHQGVKLWQEGQRQGDELDRRADMQETLNQIRETQRLIEALIDLYEEKSEHRSRTVEASTQLVQTQAEIQATLVLQG